MPMQQIKIPLDTNPSCMEILELPWLISLIKPVRLHGVLDKMQKAVNFPETSCTVFI